MGVERHYLTITIASGADLSNKAYQHKAVTLAGTVGTAAGTAIGLLKSFGSPNQGAGEHVTVGYFGQMKAVAGAAVNSGARVAATTSGYIIAATSAQLFDGGAVCGRALEGASSGDIFTGLFNFVF